MLVYGNSESQCYILGEEPLLGDGFIVPPTLQEQICQDAYPLPKAFEWCTMDLNDSKQVTPYARFTLRNSLILTLGRRTSRVLVPELCR